MSSPMRSPERTYYYFMDDDGDLSHAGAVLDEPELYHFFLENLQYNPGAQAKEFPYVLLCKGERNLLQTSDVPYVVQSLEWGPKRVTLIFQGHYQEVLDPSTLGVGKGNVLYCRVRNGAFPARFSRKAYYTFAENIYEKRKQFFVKIGGKEFCIPSRIS